MESTEISKYVLRIFNIPVEWLEEDLKKMVETIVPVKEVCVDHGYGHVKVEFFCADDLQIARNHLNGCVWDSRLIYAIQ